MRKFIITILLCFVSSQAWAFPPGFIAGVTASAPAAPSGLSVSDDFARAAGALGGVWIIPVAPSGSFANPVINSAQAVRPGVATRLGLAYWNDTWTDDHKACVFTVLAAATTTEWGGAGARMATNAYTGYFARAYNGNYELIKALSGTVTVLGTYSAYSAGTEICVSAVGDSITIHIADVAQTPVTDTDIGTGYPGIASYAYFAVDNFTGDDI